MAVIEGLRSLPQDVVERVISVLLDDGVPEVGHAGRVMTAPEIIQTTYQFLALTPPSRDPARLQECAEKVAEAMGLSFRQRAADLGHALLLPRLFGISEDDKKTPGFRTQRTVEVLICPSAEDAYRAFIARKMLQDVGQTVDYDPILSGIIIQQEEGRERPVNTSGWFGII